MKEITRIEKLIIFFFLIVFAGGIFLSVRFINAHIKQSLEPSISTKANSANVLDIDAFNKVKDRFQPSP